MTREEAIAFAREVLGIVSYPENPILLDHQVKSFVSVTHARRFTSVTIDYLQLQIGTALGSDIAIDLFTNVRDLPMLRRIIHSGELTVPPKRPPPSADDEEEDRANAELRAKLFAPQTYLPVTLWHATTYDAIDGASAEALQVIAQQLATAKLFGTGTLALNARSQLALFPQGRISFGESTDSELTVTARTPDRTASGWSGQSHRDWTQLNAAQVVHEAIEFAQRGQHPVRVEPGKYTTILSHHAVGTLLNTAVRDSWFNFETAGPFAYKDPKPGQPTLKLGERVFDPRLTLWTDPTDPEGGDFPFFEGGYASGRETWIKDGVLRAMAYDEGQGISRHKTPVKEPFCVRMSGGTTPIDEMIATCERGIYVNRLSGVRIVDNSSGTMSGVTRDGCFLIKDGKIAQPIINFQFYQSPMFSFNNIETLGVPHRVAFGFAPNRRTLSRPANLLAEWPRPPVIVPPMKVQNFNFASLVDAV
jgi:hypothetical protein